MTLPVVRPNRRLLNRARRLREDLHRHPELAFEEHRTGAVAAEALRKAGLDEVRTGVGETGVVGLLRGGRPGGCVALRADMDALPIQEETGLPYASVHKGVMHACGHDGHVAVLMGAAELLSGMRDAIGGSVKFIFQPAEEGDAGARRMVKEGCLKDPAVDCIFALHSQNTLRPGRIELSLTPYVAMDAFALKVFGHGGHGSRPHTCVDPVMIGAQIVSAAQTIVSREISPDRPVVLSFCSFRAGTKGNIIPDTALLLGTIRAMDMPTLRRVRRALGRLAGSVARAMRGRVEITGGTVYPPVHNDAALVELVRSVGVEVLGRRNVLQAREQRMGAEDFAFYLKEQGGVPGAMFSLGVGCNENLHTARFDFGSAALEPGILMLANVALRALAEGPASRRRR